MHCRLFIKETLKRCVNWAVRIKFNISTKWIIYPHANVYHSTLSKYVSIGEWANVTGTHIGECSYVGSHSYLPFTKIGAYSSIASHTILAAGNHPIHYVSTSPSTYSIRFPFKTKFLKKSLYEEENIYTDDAKKYYCEIGNDVWIATNVTLVCGKNALRIGDGAVVRAGAVVTQNVPPYAIVQGLPAKITGYRFTPEQIRFLLELKWWNKGEEWIANHMEYFTDIDKLMEI